MAEVSTELLYEVLKSIQTRLAGVDGKIDELKHDMQAMRSHMIGVQQEISGIHATLVRHEIRLDRIESRLELTDAPSL
jgi:predicted  nucleic acid-binding Zn-ribbon protein